MVTEEQLRAEIATLRAELALVRAQYMALRLATPMVTHWRDHWWTEKQRADELAHKLAQAYDVNRQLRTEAAQNLLEVLDPKVKLPPALADADQKEEGHP